MNSESTVRARSKHDAGNHPWHIIDGCDLTNFYKNLHLKPGYGSGFGVWQGRIYARLKTDTVNVQSVWIIDLVDDNIYLVSRTSRRPIMFIKNGSYVYDEIDEVEFNLISEYV